MEQFKLTKSFSSSFGQISDHIKGEGPPIILVDEPHGHRLTGETYHPRTKSMVYCVLL